MHNFELITSKSRIPKDCFQNTVQQLVCGFIHAQWAWSSCHTVKYFS